ncbi:hypothetical protein N0V84_003804 [Fusarium piperis]|uniref:Uncharacterized protein n=1 Tax=Fusarium piperis TaxID=1435070 RepID=A0A9W8WH34_9HYPO|nr:hypothetical protein N0V84_003804 [Fusarium piperis]
MSDQQSPRPDLGWFGRREPFRRFDNLSDILSVGTETIGKMTVDCKFLFKQSHWGVMGEGLPAGIIYMDLIFGPPQGCRVKSVTATVTLDEDDGCLNTYKAQNGITDHESDHQGVRMGPWFGPDHLVGPENITEVEKTKNFHPEVHFMGSGAKIFDTSSSRSSKASSRWSFNGQLLPDKEPRAYKTLQWHITGSELKSPSFPRNCVHTAFSFQHSGQPFLMKVMIEGKLAKWNQRAKEKLNLKFGSSKDREGQTATLIHFKQLQLFTTPLDQLGKSLPKKMMLVNRREGPVMVPNTVSPSFQATESRQDDYFNQTTPDDESSPQPPQAAKLPQRPLDQRFEARQAQTEATDEDMTRMFQATILSPPRQEIMGNAPQSSRSDSQVILVDPAEVQEKKTSQENETTVTLTKPNADQQAMLKILEFPALLTLLQFIAVLMDMLGRSRKAKAVTLSKVPVTPS